MNPPVLKAPWESTGEQNVDKHPANMAKLHLSGWGNSRRCVHRWEFLIWPPVWISSRPTPSSRNASASSVRFVGNLQPDCAPGTRPPRFHRSLQKKKTGSPSPFLSSAFTVSHLSDKTMWAACVCSPGSFRLVMEAVTSQINLALTALFSF